MQVEYAVSEVEVSTNTKLSTIKSISTNCLTFKRTCWICSDQDKKLRLIYEDSKVVIGTNEFIARAP